MIAFKLSTRADASDKLALTLRNDDLAVLGHPAVQHGTTLDVRWGYPDNMAAPRRVCLEDFNGFTDLALTFSGCERALTLEAKTRSWTDATISRVVEEVARTHGYTGRFLHLDAVDDTALTTVQSAETDAALLQRLATEHGREFFVNADGLHWKRPQKCRPPVILLRYMESPITSISFSSNLARHVGRVEIRSRDPLLKTTVRATSNAASVERDTLGESIEVVDPELFASASQKENAKASVHPSAAGSALAATSESDRRFKASESAVIESRITLVGDPKVVAKDVVGLEGVTRYLSGNYYVQEAVHTIDDNGYSTDLTLRSDGAGSRPGQTIAPQGGTRNQQNTTSEDGAVEIVDHQRFAETQGGGHAT